MFPIPLGVRVWDEVVRYVRGDELKGVTVWLCTQQWLTVTHDLNRQVHYIQ